MGDGESPARSVQNQARMPPQLVVGQQRPVGLDRLYFIEGG
jgi:hypothetical protein